MNNKINDVQFLQEVILDLLEGKYHSGDNFTGWSDSKFDELLEVRDLILKEQSK